MLLISCPNCGSRDETEFHYGGQAHVPYPENPHELTGREWAEFLFYRDNTKGVFAERWLHSTGCRQWFNMLRDTVTYDIQAVYPMGTSRPGPSVPAAAESGTASTAADSTTTGTAAPSITAASATAPGTTPAPGTTTAASTARTTASEGASE
jgi:sarcosine oxidase subunit delta